MTNTEAEPKGERRRLAAILVADVVGYSSLMERDEDGTLRRIGMWRDEVMAPLVARHHGRVVKTMGDGALVEFASAVDATRAALDWQSAAVNSAGLQFRIGLNVSDVIVEDEDVFGTGVNVAARLEQAADPGGICISADMLGHIRGRGYRSRRYATQEHRRARSSVRHRSPLFSNRTGRAFGDATPAAPAAPRFAAAPGARSPAFFVDDARCGSRLLRRWA
ncbi:MAG: adenylate/guanylate cyclase domain-containing protein [Mesorhizobium sp.]|nr:MAG: adenylate/guanylate cyclase domain-containing protein [Mesorhizobium sp.]